MSNHTIVARENSRSFLIVFLGALAAFGPFMIDFYISTLPKQTQDFATSQSMVQLGLSMALWGLAVGQLVIGPISDQLGRKRPLIFSMVLYTVASLACAFAPTIEVFLVARFLAGFGAAGGIIASRAIAADRYTGKELGQFMGLMGAVQGLAPILAPVMGSFVSAWIGWSGDFIVLASAGLIFLLLTIFVYQETHVAFKATVGEHAEASPSRRPESFVTSAKILFKDPIFIAMIIQQCFMAGILFSHVSSSPFIFQIHFNLSGIQYGCLFALLSFALVIGINLSTRLFTPVQAVFWGGCGMFVMGLVLVVIFHFYAQIVALIPGYMLFLLAAGLTLPSSMIIALSRHRARSGFAAALLGAVTFMGGGIIAPLTTLINPLVATPLIFVSLATGLIAISFYLRAHQKTLDGDHGHEVALPKSST